MRGPPLVSSVDKPMTRQHKPLWSIGIIVLFGCLLSAARFTCQHDSGTDSPRPNSRSLPSTANLLKRSNEVLSVLAKSCSSSKPGATSASFDRTASANYCSFLPLQRQSFCMASNGTGPPKPLSGPSYNLRARSSKMQNTQRLSGLRYICKPRC